ncbi:hypothetical protein GBF35_06525 [Nonomuraea phyllanthi]|uniref:hypothetical protein n=1 Tax=Nonomuraea phyllanthi TaxID=2219224 RepID=UPI001292D5D4|nr:hypothetical protein [Nonomuraea phyllanthi]QFY06377.1 hypothetical protein GBF35_06525 [Nonomuraea phyllanthi]
MGLDRSGRLLAALSVAPALAVAGWLLAGLPLLLLGRFAPLPAVLLGLPVAALLCWAGTRRLGKAIEATPRQVAGVVAVAVASGVFNVVMHSEQIIVRRDPATYAQYAAWLAGHGSLPIPAQVEAFGGADPALVFKSVGFYQVDGGLVPQFMPGPPLLFAAGDWLGVPFAVPGVLGALAVLTVGGVVARLAGARWAVPASAVFAVSLPILYTSRTTFSEIPSLILLFGGLALTHDALSQPGVPARAGLALGGHLRGGLGWGRGLLAGLVFGLAVLVRVDGLRDVLPVLAFAGLLIAMRRFARPQGALGLPLLAGLVVGAGLGMLAAYVLSRPYLTYLSSSLDPLLLICAAVLALTAAGTAAAPLIARIRLPGWAPAAGAGLVVLIMAGLYARPWLQTVTRHPTTLDDQRTATMIAQTQEVNGLPIDGERLYFENSLHWVIWYVGLPVVVLATVAAVVLVRGLLRNGRPFEWLLPLAVVGWTTVTTLVRPEITPDHPWAARRLVPVVIPGLILLASYALAWLRGQARLRDVSGGRGAAWLRRPSVRRWGMALAVLVVLAPPAVVSIGTAFTPVERGEGAAVAAMCAKLPRNGSVLIVERVTGDRFTQVLRGMCGLPAAQVARAEGWDIAPAEKVRHLIDRVRAAGRVPVVLGAEEDQVSLYGPATQVMRLVTRQDERALVDAPDGTWSLRINAWMALP